VVVLPTEPKLGPSSIGKGGGGGNKNGASAPKVAARREGRVGAAVGARRLADWYWPGMGGTGGMAGADGAELLGVQGELPSPLLRPSAGDLPLFWRLRAPSILRSRPGGVGGVSGLQCDLGPSSLSTGVDGGGGLWADDEARSAGDEVGMVRDEVRRAAGGVRPVGVEDMPPAVDGRPVADEIRPPGRAGRPLVDKSGRATGPDMSPDCSVMPAVGERTPVWCSLMPIVGESTRPDQKLRPSDDWLMPPERDGRALVDDSMLPEHSEPSNKTLISAAGIAVSRRGGSCGDRPMVPKCGAVSEDERGGKSP